MDTYSLLLLEIKASIIYFFKRKQKSSTYLHLEQVLHCN